MLLENTEAKYNWRLCDGALNESTKMEHIKKRTIASWTKSGATCKELL